MVKVSELEGSELDYWILKADNIISSREDYKKTYPTGTRNFDKHWDLGGPIIEREHIELNWLADRWHSEIMHGGSGEWEMGYRQYGSTPLIAAMRCYVASVYGDEVDEIR